MSEELKPCPFCGSFAQLVSEGKWHWVQCSNPNCYTIPWLDLGISGAIEVWNTRPIEDSLQEQVAELGQIKQERESELIAKTVTTFGEPEGNAQESEE